MVVTEYHAAYCFDSILDHLGIINMEKHVTPPSVPDGSFPLFVTWKKKSSLGNSYSLRGCIGTFSPLPLLEGLRRYAITSAFEDHRFDPIEHSEVKQLQCGVSVLTDFEDVEDPFDWEVGTHGIQITFVDPKSRTNRRATYLPEVAKEQGWSHEEALDSLIRKAGYSGKVGASLRSSVQLTRYQSSKTNLTYDSYLEMRSSLLC
eukprot:TRINITY_DN5639_c0_g1_i1.p1 TRINITY_DN5639_c0_g1~~TRINITY_DN5639_c0_g1_i1.p1  ORF type:complete len:204 (-),score=47.58 TRINITY_DN5639_c0_g1_i1:110-721(-)